MAEFNRYDICLAHCALENDWNVGGTVIERPSNRRRRQSSGVQLSRMGFDPGMGPSSFSGFLDEDGTANPEYENAIDIYVEAVVRWKLAKFVIVDDLGKFILSAYTADYIAEHFPHLIDRKRLDAAGEHF